MMNHHLPAVPHGQPPMPPPRRQQDLSYTAGPPSLRSPTYMGYHPHMNGHPPPAYSPQQYAHWYPGYPQMQLPPRPFQPPYAPMVVSSYPHSQPIMAPAHIPPPSLPLQQPRATTPLQPGMSPPVGPAIVPASIQPHNPAAIPVYSTPSPAASSPSAPAPLKTAAPAPREPFRAPLPWLSVPDRPFPARVPRRRRKSRNLQASSISVELPSKEPQRGTKSAKQPEEKKQTAQNVQGSSEPQTPNMSATPSVVDSTQPTTPSSTVPTSSTRSQPHIKGQKPAVPVVPVVPVIPSPGTPRQAHTDAGNRASETSNPVPAAVVDDSTKEDVSDEAGKTASPARSAPKSWADLVRARGAAKAAGATGAPSVEPNGLIMRKSESLANVLTSLGEDVSQYSDKIAFLEPKGLVNTGNMCYMNSVLQILVSCVPFYQFLDHVGKRATHSVQSEFPVVDAMIMFMREFRVIDAAHSEEQLRLRLKPNELEEYGEAFIPEFVYQVIRQLPRFRDMRRGHQQDAQEFLGFLLEEMHEECARAAKDASLADSATSVSAEPPSVDEQSGDGWLEVGHKQKAAITRSSGHIAQESPITKIFGGNIRSEFKVPGNKTSVTLEPYQPLQLDIGSPDINNIVDALKGLTKPESIQGDFNSSRGPNVTATKQIFIENLPPVLILHLKRFQYDSATRGTQKIWKKIGYPLDLEIPREVFPPNRRNIMMAQGGLPKYRLIGVIYHHGKNASGGHYTVDVRRQDGREWIRLDDTVIRRIKSEDVAEAGGEEDPKVLAAALEQHKRDNNPTANIFGHIDQDDLDQSDNERGWSQVNGAGTGGHSSKKTTSAIANGVSAAAASGVSSGVRTPIGRYGSRDNKVAYLLFYQRVA
ncbi:mRNA-binding ubiquitin-specific protease UBP3 [Aspergillus clavatus NRRL 1]|uniref:Ubiquitin carboxyl-terminal hydrolase n=1 Tax=Aspergillus clavatus (strain ATCC 1007 / CBS 513.65 / DSM 816 / NCTC 3887 / NRRL 1 / QM 1276 / 107) TaxID=344612 RepID=A1CQV0_ASPCL|nr:ubiquitin C-terminal hydrolase, putative [Aspergillus clavatus NRRL 1]EAW08021.1 ubiquitin C-terminal hydrolase, putative [Aspergillus clavatus NRRL 1]